MFIQPVSAPDHRKNPARFRISGGYSNARFQTYTPVYLAKLTELIEQHVATHARSQGPITSIEWHPTDESMLAASGADNQLTVWDLSVEADDEAAAGMAGAGAGGGLKDLPPQLLFIHQGQTDIKELHFHPQIPGVIMSTAADGFNVFKPATTV